MKLVQRISKTLLGSFTAFTNDQVVAIGDELARDATGRPVGRGIDAYRKNAGRVEETIRVLEAAAETKDLEACKLP